MSVPFTGLNPTARQQTENQANEEQMNAGSEDNRTAIEGKAIGSTCGWTLTASADPAVVGGIAACAVKLPRRRIVEAARSLARATAKAKKTNVFVV